MNGPLDAGFSSMNFFEAQRLFAEKEFVNLDVFLIC